MVASEKRSGANVKLPLKTSSRRARRSRETRERLFQAALRLFAERGYLATTVEDITEAADVGKGTFFNYFPSKEHVLATFGDQRVAYFDRAWERVLAGGCTAEQALGETVAEVTAIDSPGASLFRSIFAAHACSETVRTHFRDRIRRCQRIIASILQAGQQRSEVRLDRDAGEMARLLQQSLLGLTMAWAMTPDEPLPKLSRQLWCALWEDFRCTNGDQVRSLLRNEHRKPKRQRAPR
jgi:AcrR family transcriptional regulator